MKITAGDVEHIASLARLRLLEDEKELYGSQLNDILEYIEKLNEIDTAEVEPTSHVAPMKNVFRDDLQGQSLTREEALKNAPRTDGVFYQVPRIIE
jgi:aspartyl-tRNA(Asn)/glutamyl-tRNA(Gln) amidotransferase subunit C